MAGFPPASDLVNLSGMSAGTPLVGTSAASEVAKQLAQRKEMVTGIAAGFQKRLSNFSISGSGSSLKENIDNRTTYPLPDQLGIPSMSRLALGGLFAASSPILKDKRTFTRPGVPSAIGKPTTWLRNVTSFLDPLKGFKAQLGFNSIVNMTFADKKNQKTWSEPATPYDAQYPYNKVTQTESGHVVEFDDTPGAERIHVFHRSGSSVEMHPDGKVVCKLLGGGFIMAEADLQVSVKGVCHVSVDGDANIYAKGLLNLQAEEGVNVNTKKDFNVFAKNINLMAKETSTVDGTKIDLRYVTLPGVPVWTPYGIVPRLKRGALKKDFPEMYAYICSLEGKWAGTMNRLKKNVIVDAAKSITATALAQFAVAQHLIVTSPATGAVIQGVTLISQAKTTMDMIRMLQFGIFPSGADADSGIAAVAAPKLEFPELTAEQEPVENPLGNPLAYIATTPAAANYRTLFFDTPQEMGDVELYQAHQQTQLLLGDIESVEPKLGGAKTTPVTGIVAPASLPIVNYLDRDTYRGNFSSDPGQTLGGTSFTYGELVDSLSRADVANPHITEPVTI
jgi:hypothetical protein